MMQWKVHDALHVLLLKPYTSGGGDGITVPAPVVIDGKKDGKSSESFASIEEGAGQNTM